jgi:4-amino-4-deoxy-L-arabinose transferase-like glycosyltransferase
VIFKKIYFQILLLWLMLVVLGLNGRSYFPIDETRYVTVAWNMWLNGDYLVPYLNGIAYSHKPPLLFWLINLGWKIFGVNDWWPRLVPSFFALASVLVTRKIAGRLWPNQLNIKDNASLILIGSGLWVFFSTALMFDMVIAFFTVLGIWGLLIAVQEHTSKGWLMFALAIGGGLLAKGPTILVQLLPAALLATWWNKDNHLKAKNWYLPLLYSVLGGVTIALIWAIPAGIRGGSEYQHAIFWGQTADRMVNSFAHERPFWWYVPLMPLLLFPWLFWGTFWQGLFSKNLTRNETGVRLCLAWAVPVFVAFSLISGKQVHYVLPLFPAIALLIARCIENSQTSPRKHLLPISLATILIGVVFLGLPYYANSNPSHTAHWLQSIPYWLGIFIAIFGLTLYLLPKQSVELTVSEISLFSITLVTIAAYTITLTAGNAFDMRTLSAKLKTLESQHIPLAHSGKYPGTFNFLGRLEQSPTTLEAGDIEPWFIAHPNGRLIEYFHNKEALGNRPSEYMQAYKGDFVVIMSYEQWLTTKK